MKPKRNKRRLEREKELGPERAISIFTSEKATLECGHIILNPPVQKTVHMRMPKFYRCMQCKQVNEL